MKVVNAMFGRGLGGIEQVFVDYADALRMEGHDVLCVTHPAAAIIQQLESKALPYYAVRNMGEWDFMAKGKLKSLLNDNGIEVAIAHGNRAISLLSPATDDICPLIGVAHNYNIKRFADIDAACGITKDITGKLREVRGHDRQLFTVPNMISMDTMQQFRPRSRQQPPVIGAIGRFVQKKGFDKLIYSLGILRQRGIPFKAVIAGDGEEREALEALIEKHHLRGIVTFPGWIEDKQAFYDSIDIFCLPSLHEPFGIVLLEAMRARVPIVTTRSEGPSEIVTHQQDAMIASVADSDQMADILDIMLHDQKLCATLARGAFHTVKERYTMQAVAPKISAMIKATAANYKHQPEPA